MMPPDDKPVDALDALYERLAAADAEEGTEKADPAWKADVKHRAALRLAELRRQLVPDVKPVKARPIRPALLAMTRDALLARIDEIASRMGGAMQLAHRHLVDLTDDDLRRVLETLEAPPE
jgi:hypothetical protein